MATIREIAREISLFLCPKIQHYLITAVPAVKQNTVFYAYNVSRQCENINPTRKHIRKFTNCNVFWCNIPNKSF